MPNVAYAAKESPSTLELAIAAYPTLAIII